MSNLKNYARSELERAKMFSPEGDFYGGAIGNAVLKLIDVFADEGHSGMSASIAVKLFERLARFEPITPLTGEDDEWMEVGPGLFQNTRCPHIFKENGQAYDIRGRVFRQKDGTCYTSFNSRVDVTFPYTPEIEYVDVPDGSGENKA